MDESDEWFDLVFQFTVFTSILDADLRRAVAAEMMRVVKPTGRIIWYDFLVPNPSNPDVRSIGRREIESLFPGATIHYRRITLAPPIVRLLAPRTRWLCGVLNGFPFLRTHYLATIEPRGASPRPADS